MALQTKLERCEYQDTVTRVLRPGEQHCVEDYWLDTQEKLFQLYPEETNAVYMFLHNIARERTGPSIIKGKKSDPRPAAVVSRFKLEYPELYRKANIEE